MQLFLMIVQNIVVVFLSAMELAMLVRAVMSWFPGDSNKFEEFLYAITEPLIMPYRKLFAKFNWFTDMPIDIAFFATYLTLTVLIFFLA